MGGLAGAIQGASAIRSHWIAQCEKANEPFYEEVEGSTAKNLKTVSDRLVMVLKNEAAAAERRATQLRGFLGADFP